MTHRSSREKAEKVFKEAQEVLWTAAIKNDASGAKQLLSRCEAAPGEIFIPQIVSVM